MKKTKLTQPKLDVLGIGTVAVDELIIADSYPAADSKVRVRHSARQIGGLTAIPLIAASRLGAKCAYAGVLGRDELSSFAVEQMWREKVDLKHLRLRSNSPPVHSFIVIDAEKHTRNVFSHRAVEYKLPPNWPPRYIIESTRVLFVDHSDLPSMIRAAKFAQLAGIPIVADLERVSGPRFNELLSTIDHLILSRAFALRLTNSDNISSALRDLWTARRKLVAITDGENGCWFLENGQPNQVVHQPAFAVPAVDTTGCGDVFHGAYAAALADGLPPAERIRFASAAAALKTLRIGAQAGIPNRTEVLKLLRRQKPKPKR